MSPTTDDKVNLLPHHAVIKEDSTTTKVRVVFDASSITSNGLSLNDNMLNGPKLQGELTDTLLRTREFKFFVTSDLAKMFRQVWVNPRHRKFQSILWMLQGVVTAFTLNTVTYGTKAATYLAVRTLLRLAEDEREDFPEMADIIKSNFYVDDHMGGTHTIEEGRLMVDRLIAFFKRGGFILRKFISNSKDIISHLPEDLKERGFKKLGDDEISKTLGLVYSHEGDKFIFLFKQEQIPQVLTKRIILSRIARIYDPLNLLLPIITRLRLIVQGLWKEELDWDEQVPEATRKGYEEIGEQLNQVGRIEIPRW